MMLLDQQWSSQTVMVLPWLVHKFSKHDYEDKQACHTQKHCKERTVLAIQHTTIPQLTKHSKYCRNCNSKHLYFLQSTSFHTLLDLVIHYRVLHSIQTNMHSTTFINHLTASYCWQKLFQWSHVGTCSYQSDVLSIRVPHSTLLCASNYKIV